LRGRACLVLPGYGNSGPEHWQSLWEREQPGFSRVEQADWENPDRADWVARLNEAVTAARPPVLLVAHSLACLLVAHWVAQRAAHPPASPDPDALAKVEGAFLVAPVDPARPAFPAGARSFAPVPLARLPFPSLIVASADDPYASPEFARSCASAWGGRLVEIGSKGHINASSGLRRWEAGLELLATLIPS
jgi:uncharacterized protein